MDHTFWIWVFGVLQFSSLTHAVEYPYSLHNYTWHFEFSPVPMSTTNYSFNAYNFAVDPSTSRLVTRVANVPEVRTRSKWPISHVLGNIDNYLMAFDVTEEFFLPQPRNDGEKPLARSTISNGKVLPFSYGRHMFYPLYTYMQEIGVNVVKKGNNGLKDPVILNFPGTSLDDLFLLVQLERDVFQGRTQVAIVRYKRHHAEEGNVLYSHVHTICLKLPGKEELRVQKNWIPVVRGSYLDFIVYTYPEHVVYTLPLDVILHPPRFYGVNASMIPFEVWQECVPAMEAYRFSIAFLNHMHTSRSALPQLPQTEWHGGKTAIPMGRELWVMLHTKDQEKQRVFSFVAVSKEFPYTPLRMTHLFLFEEGKWWVQYCSDIWLSSDGTSVQGALSFNDRHVGMFSVPTKLVTQWLSAISRTPMSQITQH